jgi:hypothetical protein
VSHHVAQAACKHGRGTAATPVTPRGARSIDDFADVRRRLITPQEAPVTTSIDRTTDPSGPRSGDPAEGRPDLGGPGADREAPPDPETPPAQQAPGAPGDDAPARLGERIQDGPGGIAAGEPDLLPNVETPDSPM